MMMMMMMMLLMMMMMMMVHRAAPRRRGLDAKALQRGVSAQIGVEIWRPAARMLAACWPCAELQADEH
eukprot:3777024-Karenia_brevis.AAC.1